MDDPAKRVLTLTEAGSAMINDGMTSMHDMSVHYYDSVTNVEPTFSANF